MRGPVRSQVRKSIFSLSLSFIHTRAHTYDEVSVSMHILQYNFIVAMCKVSLVTELGKSSVDNADVTDDQ